MAAPKGNKNALNNNGGRKADTATRKKVSTYKGLVLDWANKVMRGKDEELKKQLVLRSIVGILPREITGEDGSPLIIKIDDTLADKYVLTRKSENNRKGHS